MLTSHRQTYSLIFDVQICFQRFIFALLVVSVHKATKQKLRTKATLKDPKNNMQDLPESEKDAKYQILQIFRPL